MSKKILDHIPEELHEQLIREIEEILKEREQKATEEKKKKDAEVSEAMKDCLANKKRLNK